MQQVDISASTPEGRDALKHRISECKFRNWIRTSGFNAHTRPTVIDKIRILNKEKAMLRISDVSFVSSLVCMLTLLYINAV